jgi:hypothetical protein
MATSQGISLRSPPACLRVRRSSSVPAAAAASHGWQPRAGGGLARMGASRRRQPHADGGALLQIEPTPSFCSLLWVAQAAGMEKTALEEMAVGLAGAGFGPRRCSDRSSVGPPCLHEIR